MTKTIQIMIDKRGTVTNGDVIKAVFPNSMIAEDDYIAITNLDDVTSFRGSWWNAPYREEDAE